MVKAADLDRVVDGKPTSSLVMLLTANFLVVEQVDVVSHFQWTLSLNIPLHYCLEGGLKRFFVIQE